MGDVLLQQKAVQSPRLGGVLPTPPSQQVQGPPNLISYPEQHQTLSKEVQEPQPACMGLNLPSDTLGLVYVWTITPVTPSEKYHRSLQHQVTPLPI